MFTSQGIALLNCMGICYFPNDGVLNQPSSEAKERSVVKHQAMLFQTPPRISGRAG